MVIADAAGIGPFRAARLGALVGASLFALVACSGGQAASDAASAKAATATPQLPKGSLGRGEVVAIVDEGMSRFLQRVEVEASLQDGRFEGFRIVDLQPENFWRDVDLRAGDVVTAVNGKSVEKPTEVFEVFESLRTVDALSVSLIRNGERRQLTFPIVGAPQPKRAPNDREQPAPQPQKG